MLTDESLIAEVPLFQLLDADERKGLAAATDHIDVAAGTAIFHYGDKGDSLYIVNTGKVELFVNDSTGDKISLTFAERGDVFGELSLFDDGPRTASAVAVEDTKLLVLDRVELQKFLTSRPAAALDLLATLGKRIRQTDELLRGRVARNPNQQIEHEFTWAQKGAMAIADFSGSIPFFFLNAAFFTFWITANVGLIPSIEPFDPYPFGFLTMAVSLQAIFLSIIVLLAQNLSTAQDKIRGEIEYNVNLKAELEIAHLHEKVDRFNAEVLGALHQIKKDVRKS